MNNSIFGMMAHKTHKFKDSNTSWAVKNGYQRAWRGYKKESGLRPRQSMVRVGTARSVVVAAVHAGQIGTGIVDNEGLI